MKRRHLPYLGLLVAVLIAAGCSSPATPGPTTLPATDTPPPAATTSAVTPAPIEGEVPMGFTEDGAPYRGDPNAPVTLLEYSDFL